jgi:hypothetical protein
MIYIIAALIIIGCVILIRVKKKKKYISFDIETIDLNGNPYSPNDSYIKNEEYARKTAEYMRYLLNRSDTVVARVHRNVGKSTDMPKFDILCPTPPDWITDESKPEVHEKPMKPLSFLGIF